MALVESVSVPLGTTMPPFELADPAGRKYKGEEVYGERGLLVIFTCNHCPYAKAVWPRLIKIAQAYSEKGVNTVALNPNINPNYPEDSPEKMQEKIKEWQIPFPYLIDETQNVARSFKAQCTPDIYLFDSQQELVYHGRIDDNWEDESRVTRHDLKEAIENLVAGKPIAERQFPSMGCSIKWK